MINFISFIYDFIFKHHEIYLLVLYYDIDFIEFFYNHDFYIPTFIIDVIKYCDKLIALYLNPKVYNGQIDQFIILMAIKHQPY
jgi:hypothetical protein